MRNVKTSTVIKRYSPCQAGRKFLERHTDLRTAWQKCPRGEWLVWAMWAMMPHGRVRKIKEELGVSLYDLFTDWATYTPRSASKIRKVVPDITKEAGK